MKLTGNAPPLVAPTVKVVLPIVVFCDPTVIVAVRLILFEILLTCAPRTVKAVVVVMVMLELPFKKTAEPLPLVVARVNVIVDVLLDGETVAVIVAVLP